MSQFRLYPDGSVQFSDPRVTEPVTFAHLADTHLYPPPDDRNDVNHAYRATSCNQGLKSLDMPYTCLERYLARMLDDTKACGADFVSLGGDILDCYHPETARMLGELCAERGLPAYYQMGNHDWDTEWPPGGSSSDLSRLPAQKYDLELRNERATKLMTEDWGMPGLYYSFECKGVRFVCLDTIHRSHTKTWQGKINSFYGEDQADWLVEQLGRGGPTVIFQHVPFNPTTAEYEREPWASWTWGCVSNDSDSLRVRTAIESCPDVLGVFVGHKHFCSEDPLGPTHQFMTGLACEGDWRLVKIASTPSPESSGRPMAGDGKVPTRA